MMIFIKSTTLCKNIAQMSCYTVGKQQLSLWLFWIFTENSDCFHTKKALVCVCVYIQSSILLDGGVDCHRSRCSRFAISTHVFLFACSKGSDVFQLCLFQMQKTRPSWKQTLPLGVKMCSKRKANNFSVENTCLTPFFSAEKTLQFFGSPWY